MSGFATGLSIVRRGLSHSWKTPAVRRAYLQMVAVLLLVATALDVAGIWAVVHYTAAGDDAAWWAVAAWWLVRIAGVVVVLLVASLASLTIVNNVFPLLGQRVFFASLRTVAPARADELSARDGLAWSAGMGIAVHRFVLFLGLSIVGFLAGLVPVVGAVAGPVLQGWFTANALAWELLDPYFDKLALPLNAQRTLLARHRAPVVGFGLPLALAMAIPFLGPFVFGMAQASAALLVVEVIEAT